MEYVEQKDNNSEHDRSISSNDYNRGVYRSAGNYGGHDIRSTDGAGGGSSGNNGIGGAGGSGGPGSMGYLPAAHSTNYLSDSRHSGDINLNSNRPMIQSNYQIYQK